MKNFLIYFLNLLDDFIQKENIDKIRENLGKNINIYIDVGAHKGEMIKTITQNFKVGEIHAFEPNKDNIKYIKKKKMKKIRLFNIALGEKNKMEYLNVGHISSMSTINKINNYSVYTNIKKILILFFFGKYEIYKNKILVKKKMMKEVYKNTNFKKIDLIKIDTEGHEFNVIKGMGNNLIQKTKLILFEMHYDKSLIKNYSFKNIDKFLSIRGFKCINKNKMMFRKGYELIYKNQNL